MFLLPIHRLIVILNVYYILGALTYYEIKSIIRQPFCVTSKAEGLDVLKKYIIENSQKNIKMMENILTQLLKLSRAARKIARKS